MFLKRFDRPGVFHLRSLEDGRQIKSWIRDRAPTKAIVLGAGYMLWLYQRVFFGELSNEKNKDLKDLNLRERWTLIPLIVVCFWIGL